MGSKLLYKEHQERPATPDARARAMPFRPARTRPRNRAQTMLPRPSPHKAATIASAVKPFARFPAMDAAPLRAAPPMIFSRNPSIHAHSMHIRDGNADGNPRAHRCPSTHFAMAPMRSVFTP
ncbi:hypothetical protein GCM10009661_56560 [Catellatospora chokoriensis]|uniref:Uncharacterized protein n=1 Tax=Catellatospora chokoriensis TaxID=310353 RepID=A0A8J3NSG4_9ACTN|nr:hypothetical protein Cch02nite_39370 [Catellatospora chokoriensis]